MILEKDPDRVNENIHLQSGLSRQSSTDKFLKLAIRNSWKIFASILNLKRFQWTNHNNVLLAKLGARLIRDIDIDLNVFGQKAPDIDFTLQVCTKHVIFI